jgi:hypothetical protein
MPHRDVLTLSAATMLRLGAGHEILAAATPSNTTLQSFHLLLIVVSRSKIGFGL